MIRYIQSGAPGDNRLRAAIHPGTLHPQDEVAILEGLTWAFIMFRLATWGTRRPVAVQTAEFGLTP